MQNLITCPNCRGTKWIHTIWVLDGTLFGGEREQLCNVCHGKGKVPAPEDHDHVHEHELHRLADDGNPHHGE